MIARFGGEEFAIMLPETEIDAALEMANSLRKDVEQVKIKDAQGQLLPSVTISIGISTIGSSRAETLLDLIAESDKALYRAKKAGRNCVCE